VAKQPPLFEKLSEVRDGNAVVADFIHAHRDAVLSPRRAAGFDQGDLARQIGVMSNQYHEDMRTSLNSLDHGFHPQGKVKRSSSLRRRRDVSFNKSANAKTRGSARRANSAMREALSYRGLYKAAWREEYMKTIQARRHIFPISLFHKPSQRRKRLAAEGSAYVANLNENLDQILDLVEQENFLYGQASEGHIAAERHHQHYRSRVLSYEEFLAELRAGGQNGVGYTDQGDVIPEMHERYITFLNLWSASGDRLAKAAQNGDIIDYIGADPDAMNHGLDVLAKAQQSHAEVEWLKEAIKEDLHLMEEAARTSARWFGTVQSVTPRTPLGRIRNFVLRNTVTPVATAATKGLASAMKLGFIPLRAAEAHLRRYSGYGSIPRRIVRAIGLKALVPINRLYSLPMNKFDQFSSHRENLHNDYKHAKEAAREAPTRLQSNMQRFAVAAEEKGASYRTAEALVQAFGIGVAQDVERGFGPAVDIYNSLGIDPSTNPPGQRFTTEQIAALGHRFIAKPYDRDPSLAASRGAAQTQTRTTSPQAVKAPARAVGPATPNIGGFGFNI
jgi:hypothetical protein